ncbi:unnamed protein product [Vitrella brassicaformis CCMP3155]|uniref:Uncharacterized protein n=1 Tax=Vitrella brassicaformis (strain CCMP3155) TaxID=1169540 RepID=A0A0G4H063_VITBC|nr:unnamed protein product [Vitrella brassicaformis CCMP3155]|eukprot:CEM36895.1 unnamed protein product [Vitrella brassicaformis CCMP3155]
MEAAVGELRQELLGAREAVQMALEESNQYRQNKKDLDVEHARVCSENGELLAAKKALEDGRKRFEAGCSDNQAQLRARVAALQNEKQAVESKGKVGPPTAKKSTDREAATKRKGRSGAPETTQECTFKPRICNKATEKMTRGRNPKNVFDRLYGLAQQKRKIKS